MKLFLSCLAAILWFGLTQSPLTFAQEEKAVLTVTLVQPVKETWPQIELASGGIHAWQEAVVASEIGGLSITSIPVDVGTLVQRGQELVQLNDATIQASLALQRANVAKAKAGLALAKTNGDRARGVKGTDAFPEQKSTQYLLAEEVAKAELNAALALQEIDEVRLKQTRILAADDGVISSRNATLGAVVQVGTELLRLVRQNRLEWRAEMTASQLVRIKPKQTVRLILGNGQTTEAVVRQIAPTLDPNTRNGLVYCDLAKDAKVLAGMFAQGEFQVGQEMALTLPQSVIVPGDGFTYLFVLIDKDHVARRKVTTGRRQGDRIEILSGEVAEQSRIVATGGAFLKDGDRVLVKEATP